jgi:hypothetical protein
MLRSRNSSEPEFVDCPLTLGQRDAGWSGTRVWSVVRPLLAVVETAALRV